MQFRKLAAIGGSALMTGLSLAGAAMAATNLGNIADLAAPVGGAAHFPLFVVGKDAKTSDVAGAINVAVRFAAESKTKVATSAQTVSTSAGEASVSGGNYLYVGDALNQKATLSKTDLPVSLAQYKFSDSASTAYTSEFTVLPGAQSAPTYGRPSALGTTVEPFGYVNATQGSSVTSTAYMYALKGTFSPGLVPSTAAVQGTTLKLFGTNWVLGANDSSSGASGTVPDLVLYGGGTEKPMDEKTPTSFTIGDKNHTITVDAVTSATAAYVTVDSSSSTAVTKGFIYTIGGVTVYVKDLIYTTKTGDKSRGILLLGASKLVLANGQNVKKGVTGDSVYGTSVALTTSNSAGTSTITDFTVYIGAKDSTTAYVKEGETFTDPVFGTMNLKFSGFSPALGSGQKLTVSPASSGLSVAFKEKVSGVDKTGIQWARDPTTATASSAMTLNWYDLNKVIHVVEGESIAQGEYFFINGGGYGYLYKYDTSDTGGSSSNNIKLQDQFSGKTDSHNYNTDGQNATWTLPGGGVNVYAINQSAGANVNFKFFWGTGNDKDFRSDPGQTDTASYTSVGGYTDVFGNVKLDGGSALYFTAPNTTVALINNTAKTILLPTGYLSFLYLNASNAGTGAAGNVTWFNISAIDTATLTSIANSTTALSFGHQAGSLNGTAAWLGTSAYQGILVGRQWYAISTNGSLGTDMYVNISITKDAATAAAITNANVLTNPALLLVEPTNDNVQHETVVIPASDIATSGAAVVAPTFSGDSYSATFGSTTTKYMDLWGTRVDLDSTGQGTFSMYVPSSQTKAVVLIKESGVADSSGTSTTSGDAFKVVAVTADIARLDTEVSATDKANSDFVIVGGPCVNKLAAELLGKTYPACADETATSEADALTKTGIPKNAALVKVYADKFATGKVAVLIAGWRAGDTDLAANAVAQGKLAGKTDMAVKVSGSDVATSTIVAYSG